MDEQELLSFSAAARELGVHRATVADLVTCLGIKHVCVGNAKGVDRSGMKALRKVLNLTKSAREAATVQ